jgi:hypothetical protein
VGRLQTVRDAEVAGSNPAHPTFSQLRGPVIAYTRVGYVVVSGVLLVSPDKSGESSGWQRSRHGSYVEVSKESVASP